MTLLLLPGKKVPYYFGYKGINMKIQFRFKSLRNRLTFWFLVVALTPLVLISIVCYHQRVNSAMEREMSKLTAIRELNVNKINEWIDERMSDILTMAYDPEIRSLGKVFKGNGLANENRQILKSVRENLNYLVKNHEDYSEIYIINPLTGNIEVSTNKLFIGENRSTNSYFTEPMRTQKVYIKDIFYSKNLKIPSMTISVPIFCNPHRNQHIIGILVTRLNLERSIFAMLMNRPGLDKTGETIIVNKDLFALNELRGYPGAPLRLKIDARPAILAINGESGIIESKDYRGEKVLAAYGFIDKTGWGFIAKQDMDEINAPAKEMLINFLAMLIASVAAVCIAALFLSRNIARPMLEMAEVSKKIQEGDITARNRIFTSDELGFLAKSFNNMTESLERQMRIHRAVTNITESMVAAAEIVSFRKILLEKLIEITVSDYGVYYVKREESDIFDHLYSIGITADLLEPYDASFFEGEFGKSFRSKKISRVRGIDKNTVFQFKTFTGSVMPKEIITIPIVVNDTVRGMIALACVRPYSQVVPEILDKVWIGMNIAFSNLVANEKTRALARELKDKNQELETQTEQLLSHTYELRQQSKVLQKQNIELEIKRHEVEEANNLKNQFLSNMSHELRTPLNSIMGLSRVLLMQAKEKISNEEARYLEVIERNGKNLLDLINDILDLAKIESGRIDLHPELISPLLLVEMIMESLEPIVREKGIYLKPDFPEDFPHIVSDEARLHQVLLNVIGNAVKFTEKGGVTVSGKCDDHKIQITVSDTGIGIPKKEIQYIFDEFRQIDGSAARKYEGTGLGLAIARKSVHMLGGAISVESVPGKGSTFAVTLPLSRKEIRRTDPGSLANQETEIKPKQKTVLVVDDDPDIVKLIAKNLIKNGYNVIAATSGEEAIRLSLIHRPFAITLDIFMPDMDGWEVLQKLKAMPDTKDIPVIVVSMNDDTETAFALGATGYVSKPLKEDSLISEIHKIDIKNRLLSTKCQVMIVEDNEFERAQMVKMIENAGMSAFSVENGLQCVSQLEDEVPDIIILDLVMPEMDGFTVLEKIRSHGRTAGIPVIIVTSKDLTNYDRKRLSGNVSSILTKNLSTPRELIAEIITILSDLELSWKSGKSGYAGDAEAKRILIIENNPDNLTTINAVLQDRYTIIHATDGRGGFRKVLSEKPDLVLLDMALSGIDGVTIVNKIKNNQELKHIPVIALTAQAMKGDREQILRAGCNAYLSKPFDPDELVMIIEKWMR